MENFKNNTRNFGELLFFGDSRGFGEEGDCCAALGHPGKEML